jgi:hypothetical protein
MRAILVPAILGVIVALTGCTPRAPATRPAMSLIQGLSNPVIVESVDAYCVPPDGWKAEPLKSSSEHAHQIWISPSGNTAYGVIRFNLPLPVGHDLALWGFLREMRKSEGEATLVNKAWDPDAHGLRFVADGGLYTVRTILRVRGFRGWAVYAGTLREKSVEPSELKIAETARENTVVQLARQDQPHAQHPR